VIQSWRMQLLFPIQTLDKQNASLNQCHKRKQ
jgi:hypothetical protein